MRLLFVFWLAVGAFGQTSLRVAGGLQEVHRIYVGRLSGGVAADSMREVLISALNSTGLFILTDDEKRADAVLKGAADDKVFTDTFDSDKGISGRTDGGLSSGGRTVHSGSGGYAGFSGGDRESYHLRDRKHEAYAAVRLVNRAGDVVWSTTQESQGAKFRSASTDVGEKVARQMVVDMNRADSAEKSF